MSKYFLIALIVFASTTGQALPLPKPGLDLGLLDLPIDFTSKYDFSGIVALSNCSGSLIRFEHSKTSDRALVLTNGHCLESGFTRPGQFVSHQPSQRQFRVLGPQAENLGLVTARDVVYSTMSKTDITLYELNQTYLDIDQAYNIKPLTLSAQRPSEAQPLEVISGYWRRGYGCAIETFVNQLKEEGWTWVDAIRYSRPGCETIGGTSGSPVIAKGTRTVIAINNTGNENGEACSENNPCEVAADGSVSYHQGYSYAEQTYWIYSCLNHDNVFDLNVPGCELVH